MGIEAQPATDEQIQDWGEEYHPDSDWSDYRTEVVDARVAALIARIRKAEAEVNQLKADQAGFPHLHDMRQCMVDTADENKTLRTEVERITEVWNRTAKVANDLSVEVERLRECLRQLEQSAAPRWVTDACRKYLAPAEVPNHG